MKIVATSDIHGHLPEIPPCDILLIAGDICHDYDNNTEYNQEHWLNTTFRHWLEEIPAKEIVACAGNHDFVFQNTPGLVPKDLRWHYLQDKSVNLFGLKIYGSPWQKRFWDWAFNLDEDKLDLAFSCIPECDILVTHAPPYKIGDKIRNKPDPNIYNQPEFSYHGSYKLLEMIREHQPKLHVFGHFHQNYGRYKIGNTLSCNVSYVNYRYIPTNLPMEFDLDV